MPSAKFVRRSPIAESFRTAQVKGMFDVPATTEIVHEWDVVLPVEEKPWTVGLVVGASGTGKTTVARELWPDAYFHERCEWPEGAAIVDGFPEGLGAKEITGALSSVGISSPPHWLKPFAHLSNGQKFRAELARVILMDDPLVIFDEFTSVVDRDVAKVCCHAVQKTIRRRQRPQLIALSCHFDIIDWLQPDWVYDVGSGAFEWRSLWRHPEIKLSIFKTNYRAWPTFRGHHYLSADILKTSSCYVAMWGEKPVALVATVNHFSRTPGRREHRCVVLPDFQGVGIGNRVSEYVAAIERGKGHRYYSMTSHPAMIHHRAKSPLWRMHRGPSHRPKDCAAARAYRGKSNSSCTRISASFEFVGKPLPIAPDLA